MPGRRLGRRQWFCIATSFTAWSRTANRFSEAARPPTNPSVAPNGAPRIILRPLSQGGGRDGLTLGYYLASPTGTKIIAIVDGRTLHQREFAVIVEHVLHLATARIRLLDQGSRQVVSIARQIPVRIAARRCLLRRQHSP